MIRKALIPCVFAVLAGCANSESADSANPTANAETVSAPTPNAKKAPVTGMAPQLNPDLNPGAIMGSKNK